MKFTVKKGQSLIEYGVLILIVVAAIAAMTTYIMRAMNARLRQSHDELRYYSVE